MNNRVIIFNNVTAEFVEVGPKLAAAFLEKNKKHGFEAGNNGLKLLAFHGPPMHDRE